jgi:hypothetical protein
MKKEIEKYSNPAIVQQQANKYLGDKVYISTRKDKKSPSWLSYWLLW